ncbi:MAG TPA: hypothetical protein DCG54_04875 [Anaerolineae bacterium]|jgi:hypothetical protein|nr:hypothetical protein [Anaerolineae bacterium]
METFVTTFVSIFVFVAMVFIGVGLNLKKWPSWLLGVYGFITGLLLGLFYSDIKNAFVAGMLFAFGVLSGGAMTRWHRMTWDKETVIWLLRPETKKKFPLLTRFFGWFL